MSQSSVEYVKDKENNVRSEYEIPYSDKPNSKWIIYRRLVIN